MKNLTLLGKTLIILLMVFNNNNAEALDKEQMLLAELGKLSEIKVNISCDKKAQGRMNKGTWLNQHKMYSQAERTYLDMIDQYPDCAMAYWGYAMTLLQPGRSIEITQVNLSKSITALKTAVSLSAKTKRENDRINAVNNIAFQLSNIKAYKNQDTRVIAKQ